jgi:hypothetical protein
MANRLSLFFAFLIVAAFSVVRNANAQGVTAEATFTGGASTDTVAVGASQVRTFGELRGWRFYGDASFATRNKSESDAFGAAYPYEPRASLLELKLERTEIKGQRLLGLRIGRYRTPFGIYSGSDQGYVGFSRAPLMRNSYYWALSNNYLETGGSVIAGTTWLSAEASAGIASDQDEFARPGGLNSVIRVQAAGGPLIIGASYIRTRPSKERWFATGTTEFTGADLRWMKDGVQLRGEWITGRPFSGAKTHGAYVDGLIHRPRMGPVTAVARIEYLDYLAGPFSEFPRRYTLGARVRLTQALTAQVNYIRQPHQEEHDSHRASLDIGLSYTIRMGSWLGLRGQ